MIAIWIVTILHLRGVLYALLITSHFWNFEFFYVCMSWFVPPMVCYHFATYYSIRPHTSTLSRSFSLGRSLSDGGRKKIPGREKGLRKDMYVGRICNRMCIFKANGNGIACLRRRGEYLETILAIAIPIHPEP